MRPKTGTESEVASAGADLDHPYSVIFSAAHSIALRYEQLLRGKDTIFIKD